MFSQILLLFSVSNLISHNETFAIENINSPIGGTLHIFPGSSAKGLKSIGDKVSDEVDWTKDKVVKPIKDWSNY